MSFFFFKNAKTTAIYTLSLHDALPIWLGGILGGATPEQEEKLGQYGRDLGMAFQIVDRSEEHTSELQSRGHLVCRLLLEKKKPPALHNLLRELPKQYTCRIDNAHDHTA